jgi:hypothetical protein
VTVYLDPQAGLPSRQESAGPRGDRVVRFSDWREFSGIQLPGTIRQALLPNAASFLALEYDGRRFPGGLAAFNSQITLLEGRKQAKGSRQRR